MEQLRLHLALYDPSQPSAEGSFWSWRSPSLDRRHLDRLYYDIAAANRPEDPSQLSDSSIVGGFALLAADQMFAYRFGNGGRDTHGRPGRFVMVVAGLRLDQSNGSDLAAIMTCQAIAEVLTKAPYSCPIPAPAELEVDVIAPPSRVDPVLVAKVVREERLELSGPEAMSQAAGVCVNLPADRKWKCSLRMDDQVSIAVVECPRAVEKPVPLPPKRPTPEPPVAIPPSPVPPTGVGAGFSLVFRCWVCYAAVVGLFTLVAGGGWWLLHHMGHDGISRQSGDHSGQLQPIPAENLPHPTTREVDSANRPKPPTNRTMSPKSGNRPL